jgi:AraC-like DNA-binding protein
VTAWNPSVAGIREVLHAQFRDHAYPPHTHDTWTLFLVDAGTVRYDLNRRMRDASTSMVSLLPPRVVHDGRPGSAGWYRKRVLYIESTVLPESLIGPAVDRPALLEHGLRGQISRLHDVLGCADDRLEAETRFVLIADRVRAAFGAGRVEPEGRPQQEASEALRAYLDERVFERVTLAEAADELGWSPAYLARAFSSVFAIAPHAYVLGRRMEAARRRILEGQPLAQVATDVGFFDQAHLTRRFKRFLGTTPQRFAQAGRRTSTANGTWASEQATMRPIAR